MDGIGGRRFYAAKSLVNDEGRRFYFAWAHDRADNCDTGEWYWGGAFCIPHEVCTNADGELEVKMPREIAEAFDRPVEWTYTPAWGNTKPYGPGTIQVNSLETFSYAFCDVKEEKFMFSCKVRPGECHDHFGLLIKSDDEVIRCLQLVFECGMQRVSLINLPMDVDPFWRESTTYSGAPKDPGPDGIRVCEKPFNFRPGDVIDLKVVIDHDMIEIFAGEKVAFTYRSYEAAPHAIGVFAQDANVEFFDISVTA